MNIVNLVNIVSFKRFHNYGFPKFTVILFLVPLYYDLKLDMLIIDP